MIVIHWRIPSDLKDELDRFVAAFPKIYASELGMADAGMITGSFVGRKMLRLALDSMRSDAELAGVDVDSLEFDRSVSDDPADGPT